jgi:hypothetical protein
MSEKLNVRLGNPMVMFFWSFAMLLVGIAIGEYWHPSRMQSAAIAAAAGVLTMIHELVCCFVWCSLSAWWIGLRAGELKGGH